jgi:hypothetical protein
MRAERRRDNALKFSPNLIEYLLSYLGQTRFVQVPAHCDIKYGADSRACATPRLGTYNY